MKKQFLTEQEQRQIVDAIVTAEKGTSAEIRVHIDAVCKGDAIQAALVEFRNLKMDRTAEHNGVLVYVAHESKKCAIIGDSGINNKVEDHFWNDCYELMVTHFKKEEFAEGIAAAILKAGEKLKQFFPYQEDDVNELSDEISFGTGK